MTDNEKPVEPTRRRRWWSSRPRRSSEEETADSPKAGSAPSAEGRLSQRLPEREKPAEGVPRETTGEPEDPLLHPEPETALEAERSVPNQGAEEYRKNALERLGKQLEQAVERVEFSNREGKSGDSSGHRDDDEDNDHGADHDPR